jgi:hypothetical protein
MLAVATILAAGSWGCKPSANDNSSGGGPVAPVQLTDVALASGITFQHNNGSFGAKWAPDTVGSGVAFFDYDGDGWQDIFLVNGRNWTESEIQAYKNGNGKKHRTQNNFVLPPNKPYQRTIGALYRNNGNGTFADITRGSGLDIEMYGMGAAAGDYDNDGRTDLFVTSYGRSYLFRNTSEQKKDSASAAKFQEVSKETGVQSSGWSSSAAWLDYDRDGLLDLFVCRYTDWNPAKDPYSIERNSDGSQKSNSRKTISGPKNAGGQYNQLFRNLGHGRFADISAKVGIHRRERLGDEPERLKSKSLGVAVTDFNNDLWPDLVIANDQERNFLFRNTGKGTFIEEAEKAGIAYPATGIPLAGMGVDVADINHTDRESIVITNFSNEMVRVHQNRGDGTFVDTSPGSELGRVSMDYLGFGCLFTDIDNDGWPDLFVGNGHINDNNIKTAEQIPLLFRNQGFLEKQGELTAEQRTQGRFVEIGSRSGEALKKRIMARGVASADFDLDGDADLIIATNNNKPLLLRNDGGNTNNSIRVELTGSRSNRSAIGAVVWGETPGTKVRRRVRSGSSYLSQSELPVVIGLGTAQSAAIVIRWPSGRLTQLKSVNANQIIQVDEEKGLVSQKPFQRP